MNLAWASYGAQSSVEAEVLGLPQPHFLRAPFRIAK